MNGSVKIMPDHPSLKLSSEKRALLFQVSSSEFAEHGFNQASLNRIISKVGMSKSSFYHYFKNKTDLFQQILGQAMGPVFAARDAIVLDELTAETLWPVILKSGGELSKQINETPELEMIGRMFYRCMENPDENGLTKGVIDDVTGWVIRVLQKGQDLGVFRKDLPDTLLVQILMSIGMSMDRWMIANWDNCTEEDRLKISKTGMGLFVRILSPEQRN